jgi:tetratricopeptide (TPR) repeat protein
VGAAQRSPQDALPGDLGLPLKVQAVLQARLAQLSSPTRQLAEVAATIGREFSLALLAKASSRDEEPLVRELDELWRRRIVREHGAGAYDFSHDKLREVSYASMSAARRRLLHRHVAQALEALHAAELDPVSYQVAAHYERAGLAAQAVPYYLRAAEPARRVYANEEATALLRRGLALVQATGPSGGMGKCSCDIVARLWEGLGDVLELRAQHEEALQAYEHAQAQVPDRDRLWQARLHRKVGAVMREQRLYAETLDACNRAEVALGRPPDEVADQWWDEWLEVQVERVWAHYWLAQWPEMEELVSKIQPVVQGSGRASSRARFLTASCLMHLRQYRYTVSDEMLAKQIEALAASRECGDPKVFTDCQFEAGFLHLWRHELDQADGYLEATLELAETRGLAWMRTLTLTYLAVLCRFRGQVGAVSHYVMRAQQAAEAAHMPEYIAAAQGNWAWLAWRRHDLLAAEQGGQEALAIWRQSPLVYPFQWQALWPLIAVALEQGREEEAWAYAEALLEPTQQRLPDPVDAALEAAIQAEAENRAEAAHLHLDQALSLAREMGYL